MWSLKGSLLIVLVAAPLVAHGEGYIIGVGAEGDSADGRALTAFGDFGVTEKTWFSLTGTMAETEGIVRDNDTRYFHGALDHFFEPVGLRLGAGYWGNPDILDSRNLTSSVYIRGDAGSLSLDYENRSFDFELQSDLLRGRTAKFSADGWGLKGRLAVGDRVNLFASGMSYDYSRTLRVQPDIDVLAFVSRSRLSMINSLIDDRVNVGFEVEFGLRSIDVTAGQWQTAVDGSSIDSYSIGFLTPIGDRWDAEFRFSVDDSESYGRTTAISFYLYYFGGA